jgi:hypothetical protein
MFSIDILFSNMCDAASFDTLLITVLDGIPFIPKNLSKINPIFNPTLSLSQKITIDFGLASIIFLSCIADHIALDTEAAFIPTLLRAIISNNPSVIQTSSLVISSIPHTSTSGHANEYLSLPISDIFLIAQFIKISSLNNGMIIPPPSIPSSNKFLSIG